MPHALIRAQVDVRITSRIIEVFHHAKREALNPKGGALTDMNAVAGERVALMELFAGAIGYGKNPSSHREVAIERVMAAQLIVLASYLLMVLVNSLVAQADAIVGRKTI